MSETENEQEAGASEETWASKIESRLSVLEEKAGISDDENDESADADSEKSSDSSGTVTSSSGAGVTVTTANTTTEENQA